MRWGRASRNSAMYCSKHAASAFGDVAGFAVGHEFFDEAKAASHAAENAERTVQSILLRDVIGIPFRPLTLGPSHRTATVVSLAQAAYDERQLPSGELDRHRLSLLADALEEAGARASWWPTCANMGLTSADALRSIYASA